MKSMEKNRKMVVHSKKCSTCLRDDMKREDEVLHLPIKPSTVTGGYPVETFDVKPYTCPGCGKVQFYRYPES